MRLAAYITGRVYEHRFSMSDKIQLNYDKPVMNSCLACLRHKLRFGRPRRMAAFCFIFMAGRTQAENVP